MLFIATASAQRGRELPAFFLSLKMLSLSILPEKWSLMTFFFSLYLSDLKIVETLLLNVVAVHVYMCVCVYECGS